MVCLETTFLIDYLRGNEEARKHLANLQEGSEPLTVASPSIVELVEAATMSCSETERDAIRRLLSGLTVIPLDSGTAWAAGELIAYLTMAGQQIGRTDVFIAAIAKFHNEPLLTRDAKHFRRVPGLEVRGY